VNVLIVEDDPVMRRLIERLAAARGHTPSSVASAEEALAARRAACHEIVIVDVGLPGMDGLALCRAIRDLPDGEDSVILVETARVAPGDLADVLAAGADDYIGKPFDADALMVRLAVAERQAERIAARKEAQLVAARAQRVEGALLTAGAVEHYLGNQLSLLVGYVELIARSAALPGELRPMALEALDGGRQARQTLEKLRRIVRLEESDLGGPAFLDLERSASSADVRHAS
jgi:DNA-binding response OmpR family regulator